MTCFTCCIERDLTRSNLNTVSIKILMDIKKKKIVYFLHDKLCQNFSVGMARRWSSRASRSGLTYTHLDFF